MTFVAVMYMPYTVCIYHTKVSVYTTQMYIYGIYNRGRLYIPYGHNPTPNPSRCGAIDVRSLVRYGGCPQAPQAPAGRARKLSPAQQPPIAQVPNSNAS